jgi:hypothetical protein
MPRDQKSEEISCPLLRMISGATYSDLITGWEISYKESALEGIFYKYS